MSILLKGVENLTNKKKINITIIFNEGMLLLILAKPMLILSQPLLMGII